MNDAISAQLGKCKHEISGNELRLYPDKKITKTILSRDNNKKILIEASNGVKITICEVNDAPKQGTKDDLISKISDIMGGEVENDGEGGSPF